MINFLINYLKGNEVPRHRELNIGKVSIPEKTLLWRYWIPVIVVIVTNFVDVDVNLYTNKDGHIDIEICPDGSRCDTDRDDRFGIECSKYVRSQFNVNLRSTK